MPRIFFLRKLTLLCALLAQLSVFGQDTSRVQHYLSIGHENDFLNAIGPHTDQYYTGGAFIAYGRYKKSAGNLIDRILIAPGKAENSFYRTGFSFWMYSPTDLKAHTAQTGDYPYSGTMFLDLSRETMPDPKTLFRSELWLGFTGPFAQGSWMQETLHKSMHFIIPRGWNNQLPISPLVNYNLYLEKNISSLSDHVHFNALGYAQMGSSQDALKSGLRFTFSNRSGDFFPSRVYSANPAENSRRAKFFADLTPAIKLVGYNSLIEGTIFSRKDYYHIPASQVERVIFEGSGGFGFRTRGFTFSYREIFETREFRSVHQHVYGSLFITVRL